MTITLIYFSPTGTTRTVLEAIAEGAGPAVVRHVDLTLPGTKVETPRRTPADLTVIGVPVYAGRVPLQALSRLQRLRAKDAPAAVVVVYGNREYEDALLELGNISVESGFIPIAGAAFIGEHSFSTSDNPIAPGRPDADDLGRARTFGKMVKEKVGGAGLPGSKPLLAVPGNFPYRERNPSRHTSPETDESTCLNCGKCVEVCPVSAIRQSGTTLITDRDKCILCCACVKNCLPGARALGDPALIRLARELAAMCSRRKEPELYL